MPIHSRILLIAWASLFTVALRIFGVETTGNHFQLQLALLATQLKDAVRAVVEDAVDPLAGGLAGDMEEHGSDAPRLEVQRAKCGAIIEWCAVDVCKIHQRTSGGFSGQFS